ncbi:MAG: VWA domain-containing protein [Sulfurovum sp.]
MHFTFGSPYLLLLLLILPCLLWCREYSKIYYFPKLSWIEREATIFNIEILIKLLIATLFIIALAKPFIYDSIDYNNKKGRDLILTIDASGSMGGRGFNINDRFESRYDTTISLSKEFIKNRLDDNIGVVIFGSYAYTASPLSYDLKAISFMLDMGSVGLAGESTAIGDAIMESIRALSYGKAEHRAIILLTDGHHNAGAISPREAVAKAKEKNIKIYTIGIGKKGEYDNSLLESITKDTNAKSYGAVSSKELENIYKDIESLEPSDIRGENYLNQTLLILYPLGLGFFILLGWIVKNRFDA